MEQREKRGALAVHLVGVVAAAALFQVFLVLSLLEARSSLQPWLYLLCLIGGSVLNAALLTADLVLRFLNKEAAYKFCITAYILSVFFAVVLYILLKTGFFEIVRDAEALERFLERAGVWMSALFVTLQFLQVVILPIPSTVTVIAGAALFGPFWGSVLSLIGIVLGSLVAFLIGRYAGNRVVAWMVGKDTLDKWLKKVKGRDKLLLTAMFVLPVFPDDVLCFVAGMSSMSIWYFLIVILISRILAIFMTSYSVTLIPFDTPWGIAVWAVLGVLIIALFVLLYKKSDAILDWLEKKFRRETHVKEKKKGDEFTLEVVDPDGSVVSKGVKKEGEDGPPPSHS